MSDERQYGYAYYDSILARIATLVKPLPVKTLVDNEAVTELLKRQKQIRAILKEAENGNH